MVRSGEEKVETLSTMLDDARRRVHRLVNDESTNGELQLPGALALSCRSGSARRAAAWRFAVWRCTRVLYTGMMYTALYTTPGTPHRALPVTVPHSRCAAVRHAREGHRAQELPRGCTTRMRGRHDGGGGDDDDVMFVGHPIARIQIPGVIG